eukprot:3554492-Rhodomonas_salina.1
MPSFLCDSRYWHNGEERRATPTICKRALCYARYWPTVCRAILPTRALRDARLRYGNGVPECSSLACSRHTTRS